MKRDHAAGHRCEGDAAKARLFDHAGECLRLGKFANRFDKILVRIAITGNGLADARDQLEGIKFVKRIEPRHVDRGKLPTQKSAADAENTKRLSERVLDSRHVANTEGDGDAVEAALGIGQLLRISFVEGDEAIESMLSRAVATDLKHAGIDVADRDPRAGAPGLG